jgi:hypothetical protein
MGMRRTVLLLASIALAVIFVSGVALADSPTTKEDCKNGGYAKYGFKNQGECIKAVNHATPADTTPPEISVTGPEGTTTTPPDTLLVYTLTTNEPVTWECSLTFTPIEPTPPRETVPAGGSGPCNDGTFEWYLFNVSYDGTYVFTFKATDAAGNTSTVTKTLTTAYTP